MEVEWYADRAALRLALRTHPGAPVPRLARELGRSVSWVKKWRRRLGQAPPDDEAVLHSRSRARHHPPPALDPAVVDRLLELRDAPPANLGRVPGPRTLLYFLHRDPELRAAGARLPRSAATVWALLRRHGRIPRPRPRSPEPWDLPAPLTSWQLDFKDVSSVAAEPDGKRQHAVEALNCVDCGTSLLVATDVRPDFDEAATLEAVADLLRAHGLPEAVTLDRDPRFVGAPGAGDFPSPLVRFLTCLGVRVRVNPPQRPDLNGFVERFHRTLEYECLRVRRPATLEQAREVTAAFREHYNRERPNQARSCANRPPLEAFPDLPPRPAVPAEVDPDAWLRLVDGRRYRRTVQPGGEVDVEHERYYVARRLAGQRVAVAVAAAEGALVIRHGGAIVKRAPLRGLLATPLPFERYAELMTHEARRHDRRRRTFSVVAGPAGAWAGTISPNSRRCR
jgi:hypothetical protein